MAEQEIGDFESGVVYGFEMALNAFQEMAPPPHNDRAEPSRAVTELTGGILDVVREVAAGRLTLVETEIGHSVGIPTEMINEAVTRERRVARAILSNMLGEEAEDLI